MSTTTIVIELVDRELLTSNQRNHWGESSSRTKTIRAKARGAWIRGGRPQLDRAHCTVTVTYPDRSRNRDVHNLTPTFKAAIDGMVHPAKGVRGLLPDDHDRYLVGPDPRVDDDIMPPRPGLYARTRLTFVFTPLDPDAVGSLPAQSGDELAAEFIHGDDDAFVLPLNVAETIVTAAAGYAALYLAAGGDTSPLAPRARHVLDTCIRWSIANA